MKEGGEGIKINRQKAESSPVREFSKDVEVEGLPYLFQGTIDETNKRVSLHLVMPKWEEEIEKVTYAGAPFDLMNRGILGYVDASQIPEADLYINKIRSFSDLLPPDSKYHAAEGIGRFLMNNLTAVADLRGWTIAGFPYTNGRLDDRQVAAWMERKGFSDTKGDYMVRQPSSPDPAQEVAKLGQ